MLVAMTLDEQCAYLAKGCVDVVRADELRRKLERSRASGRPLTVKVGFDPTAPDLHLGHTVLLRKMKHFQDLGHRVIFLIGDFTGLIGDPTGRSKTRPPLTREEIDANAETYKQQVFRILHPEQTVVDFNSRWLGALGSEGFVRLAARYNVAQMLERRDFRQRFDAQQPIKVHEFLYPLAQAYDSVALEADVELGGTDQLFNLNVGRDIMPGYGLEPQIVMTVPLLVGLDGVEKMSKSYGNYVGVNEPAEVMARKLVEEFKGDDAVMWDYFTLLTDLAPAEVEQLRAAFGRGDLSATDLRFRLAGFVIADLHGAEAARRALDSVRRRQEIRINPGALVLEGGTPDVVVTTRVRFSEAPFSLPRLVTDLGFAPSTSEAARQLKAGGVRIAGDKVADLKWSPPGPGKYPITVGSRKVGLIVVE
jgi:tyrosyl-tRNA synthetase